MLPETVAQLFEIDMEAGRLFWKNPPKYHPRLLGQEAGCAHTNREDGKTYWIIKINGRSYRRGRLIYLVKFGRFPIPCVDHRDGDSLNDRADNLREATVTQNAWNHKGRKKASPLPMGVRFVKSGRYQARLAVNCKMIHLGTYETSEEAHQVYLAKRKEEYGEYA